MGCLTFPGNTFIDRQRSHGDFKSPQVDDWSITTAPFHWGCWTIGLQPQPSFSVFSSEGRAGPIMPLSFLFASISEEGLWHLCKFYKFLAPHCLCLCDALNTFPNPPPLAPIEPSLGTWNYGYTCSVVCSINTLHKILRSFSRQILDVIITQAGGGVPSTSMFILYLHSTLCNVSEDLDTCYWVSGCFLVTYTRAIMKIPITQLPKPSPEHREQSRYVDS